MSAFYFATAAKSAVGLVRAGNEDSALTSRSLIAVADGMGGHAAGEVASRIAITTLHKDSEVFTDKGVDIDSADDLYASSLINIDQMIAAYAQEKPELSGMGTTLSALFLREGAAGPGKSWVLLNGPEGGLTDAEDAAARAKGFVALSLGERVLRAETAALGALTLLTLE